MRSWAFLPRRNQLSGERLLRSARRTSSWSTARAVGTETTTPRGSSTLEWGSWSRCEERPFRRREFSLPDDCLFCSLVRQGDHVAKADGLVAIRDINPKAETHLLVLPERHVPTFREVGEFPADEAKR